MKIVEGSPPRTRYGTVAMDTEHFGLNPNQLHRPAGKLAAMTLTLDGETVYLLKSESQVEKALTSVRACRWVMHNASFDLVHLRRWADIQPRSPDLLVDTMIWERILFSGWYLGFGLDDLSRRWLKKTLPKEVRKSFAEGEELTSEQARYACSDAAATWKIFQCQEVEVKAHRPDVEKIWSQIDAPALWASLDFKGFILNVRKWKSLERRNRSRMNEIGATLGFNPRSPQQVKVALTKRRIEIPDTTEETLQKFAGDKVVDAILDYRKYAHRVSTYGLNLVEMVEEDGRVYCAYDVLGARTGRMASDSPNMQNIPVRDTTEFRECFEAPKGGCLIDMDYGSQEPRIMAELSHDPRLVGYFRDGVDPHTETARRVYHDPSIEKSDPRRRRAKAIFLGTEYGLTPNGLSARESIPVEEAEELINEFFRAYPMIQHWITKTRSASERTGYTETLYGRRMWLNLYTYKSRNHAINHPCQGSAADMIKRALGLLYAKCPGKSFPVVAVVHDAIVLEALTQLASKFFLKMGKEAMTQAFEEMCPHISINNLVDAKTGKNWGVIH